MNSVYEDKEFSADQLTERLRQCGIPGYMWSPLVGYIRDGRPVGDFLSAVLNNDLKRACAHADGENQKKIFEYVFFLTNYAPAGCWGQPTSTTVWGEHRGLRFEEKDPKCR